MAFQKLQMQSIAKRQGVAQPPRSRAFFLEVLLNILVFALCAAVAIQIFTAGQLAVSESNVLTTLALDGEALAESFKYSDGSLEELALFSADKVNTGQPTQQGEFVYYYSSSLEITQENNAQHCLVITPVAEEGSSVEVIEIAGYSGESQLFCFEVARYWPGEGS